MLNSKTCIKCGSDRVVEVAPGTCMPRLPTGMGTIAQVAQVICCDCGYVETWVTDAGDREKLYKRHKETTNT